MILVLRARYEDGKTLREVGETLGLSGQRIRQIQGQALRLLRPVVVLIEGNPGVPERLIRALYGD